MTSDLIGTKFKELVVVSYNKKHKQYHYWNCLCSCGQTKVIREDNLEKVKSCGCTKKHSNLKHGNATDRYGKSSEYSSWSDMIQRCTNPNSKVYHNYGGRGITVCQRWREDFRNFLEDMGEKPKGYTLERINNEGNYEPENCKWASRAEQIRNRRVSLYVEYNGKKQLFKDWSEELGINEKTLKARIYDYGWSIEKAFTEPVDPHFSNASAKAEKRSRKGLKKCEQVRVGPKVFESKREFAEVLGISYRKLMKWFAAGLTPEQCWDRAKTEEKTYYYGGSHPTNSKEIVCHGVVYKSIAAFGEALNVPANTLTTWFNKGVTPEEALLRSQKQRHV